MAGRVKPLHIVFGTIVVGVIGRCFFSPSGEEQPAPAPPSMPTTRIERPAAQNTPVYLNAGGYAFSKNDIPEDSAELQAEMTQILTTLRQESDPDAQIRAFNRLSERAAEEELALDFSGFDLSGVQASEALKFPPSSFISNSDFSGATLSVEAAGSILQDVTFTGTTGRLSLRKAVLLEGVDFNEVSGGPLDLGGASVESDISVQNLDVGILDISFVNISNEGMLDISNSQIADLRMETIPGTDRFFADNMDARIKFLKPSGNPFAPTKERLVFQGEAIDFDTVRSMQEDHGRAHNMFAKAQTHYSAAKSAWEEGYEKQHPFDPNASETDLKYWREQRRIAGTQWHAGYLEQFEIN